MTARNAPHRSRTSPPNFIALDGEGVERADGGQDYVLLCASTGEVLSDPQGLSTSQVCDWLCSLAQAHPGGATYVMFGASYDWQMWLRSALTGAPHAPSEEPRRDGWKGLIGQRYWTYHAPQADAPSGTGRTAGASYRLRVILGHELYLAHGYWAAESKGRVWRKHPGRSIRIWDTLGWFGEPFADACDRWKVGTEKQRADLRTMKTQRGSFTAATLRRVQNYCLRECDWLAQLMGHVAETAADMCQISLGGSRSINTAGSPKRRYPARWDGAGAGARMLLHAHQTDQLITRSADPEVEDAVLRAYFGGRIQTFVAGIVPEPIWCYDLRSAYAAAMERMPQLHSALRMMPCPFEEVESTDLVRLRWWTSCERLTPLPHRQDGGAIYWPAEGEGWYWGDEARLAMPHAEVADLIHFEPGEPPLSWMRILRDERERLPAAQAQLYKRVGNAVYGKIVQGQRLEHPERRPAYQSYVWGGWITASVRAEMLRLARRVQRQSLVQIATDCLMTTERIDAPGSGYSETMIPAGALVIAPGVIVAPDQSYVRARGLGRALITYAEARDAWERDGFDAVLKAERRAFIGASLADWSGHPEWWTTWRDVPAEIGFAQLPRQWPRPDWSPGDRRPLELLYPPVVTGLSARYVPHRLEPHSPEEMRVRNDEEQPRRGGAG